VALLVAAPDKLRGTATARQAAAAIEAAASASGFECARRPMADGGEGFLDVLGAETRVAQVHGPLGERVAARWSLLEDGTALIESAEAAGRPLLADPHGDEPMLASSYGVGELLTAALEAGATKIVVGCGGTATSDGGRGCVEALDAAGVAIEVPLVAACDVDVALAGAAWTFAAQKGASPAQVRLIAARLEENAAWYAARFGVQVADVPGAGAGGGLGGALIALGASVISGAQFVAEHVGLALALSGADLVVTAEGTVDVGTLAGKVVDVVLAARPDLPALVIAGRLDPRVAAALRDRREGAVDVVELSGALQRRIGTAAAITQSVVRYLGSSR
jgi:glycerate kinase